MDSHTNYDASAAAQQGAWRPLSEVRDACAAISYTNCGKQEGASKPMILVPLSRSEAPEVKLRARCRNFRSAAPAIGKRHAGNAVERVRSAPPHGAGKEINDCGGPSRIRFRFVLE
jgi:hypothetical protein